MNPDYPHLNAEAQQREKRSVYNFYKKLISMRRDSAYLDLLVYGDIMEIKTEEEGVIVFRRTDRKGRELQVWVNMTDEELPAWIGRGTVVVSNYEDEGRRKNLLRPYEAFMLEI